jgi:hypothetical protein
MDRFKRSLKRMTPAPLWRGGSTFYWWWRNRGSHRLAGSVSLRLWRSRRALASYRDRHLGERCFILGNGPSLRHTDLSLLRHEITFGMNRIYLLFPAMEFPTTYYAAVNTLVLEQCAEEIGALAIPKFVTWRARRWLAGDSGTVFLDTDYTGVETFSGDVSGRVFEGSTVTYVALQLAFHMGFRQVVLIGVDHSFRTQGQPNAPVVSTGDDPDHFSSAYFGEGFRWQLPDLVASERAYRMAKQAFEAAGRQIVDATIGGKLTVFPRVEYGSLFRGLPR